MSRWIDMKLQGSAVTMASVAGTPDGQSALCSAVLVWIRALHCVGIFEKVTQNTVQRTRIVCTLDASEFVFATMRRIAEHAQRKQVLATRVNAPKFPKGAPLE